MPALRQQGRQCSGSSFDLPYFVTLWRLKKYGVDSHFVCLSEFMDGKVGGPCRDLTFATESLPRAPDPV
jgi:hypothetical protein